MENLHERLAEIKSKIIKAFENVSVPSGLVAEHDCEECFEIRKIFAGKEWQTLTPEILEANYDKLPLFSHEAYHCFLPAYLIYSLDNLDDNLVKEFTGYNLMYKDDPDDDAKNWRINRYQNFTKKQIYIIYEFIDWLIQVEDYDEHVIKLKRGKQFLIDNVEPSLKI